MRKFKILASADWLMVNSGYANIARILMEEFNGFDWHYIAMGKSQGMEEIKQTPSYTYTEYPATGGEVHIAANTYELAARVKPDCLLIMEDVQWLTWYMRQRTRWPRVCYFPWDNEEWSDDIGNVASLSEFPVVMSECTRQMLEDHGFGVDLIYPYIDDKAFYPVPKDEADDYKRETLCIPEDKKVLLYVGRMFPRKNIEALYGMVQYLKKIRDDFVLLVHSDPMDVGRSSEPIIECITRDIMGNVRWTPNMTWYHGVPKKELNLVYNVADVFVSAHSGEGFGMPICEAGLCEKPFVATDYTTTAEFGGDGTHGLGVKPKTARKMFGVQRPIPDCKEFAEKVNCLLEDPVESFKMGVAFREWVLKNCSREVVSAKWKKIFEKCIVKEVGIKNDGTGKD